jgi:hypothetical protein
MTRALAFAVALAIAIVIPRTAAAQPARVDVGDAAVPAPPPTEAEVITERRAPPDYDGRDDEGPDAGDALLWVPRILFAPVWLVLDYVVRRPIGWLATTAEREDWDDFLLNTLTWNDRRSRIMPTFFLAYGLQPSVGLQLSSNDDVAPGHSIGAGVAFGGIDFVEGNLAYTIFMLDRHASITAGGGGGRRPDRIFSGIGWDAVAERYRYRESRYDGYLAFGAQYWRESTLSIRAAIDGHEFADDGYVVLSDSPSVAEGVARNVFPRPYGLDHPYVVARPAVHMSFDSREPEPAPGHGVRVQAYGELAFDLREPVARRWLRYGGGVGGFLDLGDARILGLWSTAMFSDPMGSEPVPFTELVALGQDELLMQGFLRGQLRGRSAVATTLEYRYPIWTHLDGRLHVSVGNVFDAHLSDFDVERLRLSFGFGISTAGDPNDAFQLTIAGGTAPFAQGASIDSVQLLFGNRRGF